MPNWATSMPNGQLKCLTGQQKCLYWQYVAQYLLPKKWRCKHQHNSMGIFPPIKNANIKAFIKLTHGSEFNCWAEIHNFQKLLK